MGAESWSVKVLILLGNLVVNGIWRSPENQRVGGTAEVVGPLRGSIFVLSITPLIS